MLFLIHLLGGFYCATKLEICEDSEMLRLVLCVMFGWVFIVYYVFTYKISTSSAISTVSSTSDTENMSTVKENYYQKGNEIVKLLSVLTKINDTSKQKPANYTDEKDKDTYLNQAQNKVALKVEHSNPIYSSVAGVTYNDRQKYVRQCYKGQRLKVVRDKNNAFDKNAIALYANGNQVGFIRKELAAQLSIKIDKGINFECIVENVTGGNDKYYGLNIKLNEVKNNDNIIGKEYYNVSSNKKKVQRSFHFSDNYDDCNEDDETDQYEVWTSRDLNEYFTGDRDNEDWDFPDN